MSWKIYVLLEPTVDLQRPVNVIREEGQRSVYVAIWTTQDFLKHPVPIIIASYIHLMGRVKQKYRVCAGI